MIKIAVICEGRIISQNEFPSYFEYNRLFYLINKHFSVKIADNPDVVFFLWYSSHTEKLFLNYDCIRVMLDGEANTPTAYHYIYDYLFNYMPTDETYLYMPVYLNSAYLSYKQLFQLNYNKVSLSDKTKFCNYIYSNNDIKYPGISIRNMFFQKLSKFKQVDSYGKVFNNTGNIRDLDKKYIQPPYKFSIVFENQSRKGYHTEKIIHAFLARTVPIYWGDPNITDVFNIKSFINVHDYNSWDEVIHKVIELDKDDDLYMSYLSQPPFVDNKEPSIISEQREIDRLEKIFTHRKKSKASHFYYRNAYKIVKPCSYFPLDNYQLTMLFKSPIKFYRYVRGNMKKRKEIRDKVI